jgi:hypothetical protein
MVALWVGEVRSNGEWAAEQQQEQRHANTNRVFENRTVARDTSGKSSAYGIEYEVKAM